jgi:hypothetical protein
MAYDKAGAASPRPRRWAAAVAALIARVPLYREPTAAAAPGAMKSRRLSYVSFLGNAPVLAKARSLSMHPRRKPRRIQLCCELRKHCPILAAKNTRARLQAQAGQKIVYFLNAQIQRSRSSLNEGPLLSGRLPSHHSLVAP